MAKQKPSREKLPCAIHVRVGRQRQYFNVVVLSLLVLCAFLVVYCRPQYKSAAPVAAAPMSIQNPWLRTDKVGSDGQALLSGQTVQVKMPATLSSVMAKQPSRMQRRWQISAEAALHARGVQQHSAQLSNAQYVVCQDHLRRGKHASVSAAQHIGPKPGWQVITALPSAAPLPMQKQPESLYVPAGSFMPARLLQGVVLGMGQRAKAQPVLFSVQGPAQLPNGYAYDMTGCFILGSATAPGSGMRVQVALERCTCMQAGRVLSTDKLQGYVVDSDGKLGLRGQVAQRTASRIGSALLAGLLSNSGHTTIARAQWPWPLEAGLGLQSGLPLSVFATHRPWLNAAAAVSQQIMTDTQDLTPVITVATGRMVTLNLTRDLSAANPNPD